MTLDPRPDTTTPFVIWFTGLSGSGKSTLAGVVEDLLRARRVPVHNLDGDALRRGLNQDLGYDDDARDESIRRIGEVARILVDAGHVVLVAAISPFEAGRRRARNLIEPGRFVEVFVDVPLDVAESRDPKGLYRMAREGLLRNFTGIDSPYERPTSPEVHVNAAALSPLDAGALVIASLEAAGLLASS
ncbi:MAG: adenylyl-sulfate kinase [Actinomycetales bacterium]|nr:adenylyl-sulfate kinase [Actinomycetales bacterium]